MLTHADPDILTHVKALSSSTLSTIKSDFHGATSTVHDGLFGKEYYPIEEEGSSDTHSNTHVKAKSRMNAAFYPVKDKIPDVNSPQVQAWVNEIDWAKVPNIPVAPQHPQVKHFPLCPPQGQGNKEACWWSCTGCVAKTDVITCPNSKAWGLTYDDGPSPATWSMMKHLGEMKLTATFFIVGSRVVEFPDVVREQVAQGHHLGMHSKESISLYSLVSGVDCLRCFLIHLASILSNSSLVTCRTDNTDQPPDRGRDQVDRKDYPRRDWSDLEVCAPALWRHRQPCPRDLAPDGVHDRDLDCRVGHERLADNAKPGPGARGDPGL